MRVLHVRIPWQQQGKLTGSCSRRSLFAGLFAPPLPVDAALTHFLTIIPVQCRMVRILPPS
jgi:hypothetical protein